MTKMVILQRDSVDGVRCDVNCLSRHYDFWEKRQGRWGLVLRESIYDKARLDTVNPGDQRVGGVRGATGMLAGASCGSLDMPASTARSLLT